MKTLEAVQVNEDRYFGELLGDELCRMAKDIKEAHRKDDLTEDESTIISLFQMSPDELLHEKKQYKRALALVCCTLEINLKTMPIEDQQKLEEIVRNAKLLANLIQKICGAIILTVCSGFGNRSAFRSCSLCLLSLTASFSTAIGRHNLTGLGIDFTDQDTLGEGNENMSFFQYLCGFPDIFIVAT